MKSSERVNILVVADEAEKRRELQAILSELGQNVVQAHSGRDALRHMLRDEYAVILLDAEMSEMTGLETAARIRRRRRSEHTPIVFFGETDGQANAANMRELPFIDHIAAPLESHVVCAKVGAYVSLFQKTESMRQQAAHRLQLAREQAARQVAEKAMRRSALLAEASRDLSRSLDFDTILVSLHRALVPALADACQLILCDDSGDCWFAPVDREGDRAVATRSSVRVQTVDLQFKHAVRDVIESGHARVIPGDVVQNAPALRRKRIWPNVALAPLLARDSPLGAIVCCRRGTRRRFGPADIALVEDLAGRAGTALDNAQLYQAIREGERKKDEFLAMLGHELRNPLAAIANAGELVRLLNPEDANFQETLDIIRQQARLMKRLVDDLLDVSRITSGRVQLQKATVCGGEVLARLAEAIGPLFTARNQSLRLSVRPESFAFEADPCRLEQILSNLLVNASKYTDPYGEIWFSVSREQDEAVFRVKDSGIGIGPDLLPHVFDLFSQANRSLHRSEGGLGIGLTIAKGLTDLHGGRISVASEGIGRGSEFAVFLPAPAGLPAPVPRRPTEKPILEVHQRRVLVVEDQPALQRVTVALLQRLGHEVHAAADGQEAILAVREYRPEVVFLDIGLPGMDGYEVAQCLRAEMGEEAPLLVAMTGYGQQEVDRHAAKVKFDRHLVKPADINAMQELFAEIG